MQKNLTTVGAPGVPGNLSLDGDADNTAAVGATANSIVFNPNVVLTAGGPAGNGAITLAARTGGMTDTGALTLDAKNGVTINSNLTTGAILTINADTDANQTGTFTLSTLGYGAAVNTTNHPLDITAADVVLSESATLVCEAHQFGTSTIHLHVGSNRNDRHRGGSHQNPRCVNAEIGNIINTTGLVTIGDLTDTGHIKLCPRRSTRTG